MSITILGDKLAICAEKDIKAEERKYLFSGSLLNTTI